HVCAIGEMILHIRDRSQQPFLLTAPQSDAHRAIHRHVDRLQNAHRFDRDARSGAVICRAGPAVPAIEMSADHYDLVLLRTMPRNLPDTLHGTPANIAHLSLDVELDFHRHALLEQPNDAPVMLGCEHPLRGGNPVLRFVAAAASSKPWAASGVCLLLHDYR